MKCSDMPVILLAEDEPAHVEIVRRCLTQSAVASCLVHVEDGQQALNYLQRQGRYADPASAPRPGLILLDLNMPGMSGLDVLREIKADSNLKRIPVVMLTTSAIEVDMVRAYDLHVNSYLVKQLDFDRFKTMLEAISQYWLLWNQEPPADLTNGLLFHA